MLEAIADGRPNRGRPLVVCRAYRFLVPATLESALLGGGRPFLKTGWSAAARERGLFLDLSRVEWVELSAVVRAALLVDAALRAGIHVQVAMPLPRPRLSEELWASEQSGLPAAARRGIEARVRRRPEARRFLEYLGFEQALTDCHLGEARARLRVLHDYDSSGSRSAEEWQQDADRLGESGNENVPGLDERRRYAVPLTWLTAGDPQHTAAVMEQLSGVLSVEKRGIERIEGSAMSHVLLYELVENAIRHSGTSQALVAAFAHGAEAGPRPADYREAEAGYMQWLAGAQRPGVDLVIGDPGIGLVGALGVTYDNARRAGEAVPELSRGRNASVLEWAFDRRSTTLERNRRGTRGLYRVDRVVKRHAGLITIRAANMLVGQDHGGPAYDRLVVDDGDLAYVPGTVLRAHIGPVASDYRARGETDVKSDLAFSVSRLGRGAGALTADGEPLEIVLARGGPNACHILVPEIALDEPKAIDQLLGELAEARDPGAIALIGVHDWDTVLGACELLNNDIADRRSHLEETSYDHFEVQDPVLVVGETGESAWAGALPAVSRALDALTEEPDGSMRLSDLEDLLGSNWAQVRQAFRRDTTLIARHGEQVSLRLHPSAVLEAFAQSVARRVSDGIAHDDGRVRMTASLTPLRAWVSADTVLDGPSANTAAMVALARRIRGRVPRLALHGCVLTADATASRERLGRLQTVVGAARVETAPSELGADATHYVSLAEPGEKVVIYGEVVASGESIRRALAQLMRDDAWPLVVACLADVRENAGESFTVWGLEVPVVSLVEERTVVTIEPGTPVVYVNASGQEERSPTPVPRYEIAPDDMMDLVAKREALHFGHIGGSSGRHFTFYVDAAKLLRGAELRDALTRSVAGWLASDPEPDETRLQVWFPTPEPKVPRPAETLARHVHSRFERAALHPINREQVQGGWRFPSVVDFVVADASVVIVDWGALEGTTVTELIRLAAEAGAKRVLACLCLSQLRREAEWHLRSTRTLEATLWEPPSVLFPDSGADEHPREPERVEVEVDVRFLSALPVPAFSLGDCPVCSQRATLADQRAATPAIRELIQWQRTHRLHLVAREDAVNRPVTDLDGNILPGSTTVRMLRLRRALEAALRSTRERENVVGRLRSLSPRTDEAPSDELLDLLRLLAVETPWMRRPPLVFEKVRHLLAEAAVAVALADDVGSGDRVNAIVVLRTCSKALFAARAEEIFVCNHADRAVTRQLLYGIYTYIQRPYLRAEKVWEPLVEALAGMRRRIASEEVPQHSGKNDIDALHGRAIARSRLAKLSRYSLSEIWGDFYAELGAGFSVHGVGDSARRLAPNLLGVAPFVRDRGRGTEQPEPEPVAEARRTLEVDWPRLELFLSDEVVPRLQTLAGPLASRAGRAAFGPHWMRLTRLLEDERSVTEWRITRLVRDVLEGRESLTDPRVWGDFTSEMEWLDAVILRTRLEGGGPDSEPSRLIQFLEQAPTELHAAVNAAAARRGAHVADIDTSGVPDDGVMVFFPRASLWDLVTQLVQNVEDHYEPDGDRAAGARVWIRREVADDGDPNVALVVENTATTPGPRQHGEFLAKYEEELPAFGGSIEHGRLDHPDLTYRVTVKLKRARN